MTLSNPWIDMSSFYLQPGSPKLRALTWETPVKVTIIAVKGWVHYSDAAGVTQPADDELVIGPLLAEGRRTVFSMPLYSAAGVYLATGARGSPAIATIVVQKIPLPSDLDY
jgi:hypothetical protein